MLACFSEPVKLKKKPGGGINGTENRVKAMRVLQIP